MGNQTDSLPPTLLVLNKKDLIKPGEIAKKVEVSICLLISMLACNSGSCCSSSFLRLSITFYSGMRSLQMLMRSYQ